MKHPGIAVLVAGLAVVATMAQPTRQVSDEGTDEGGRVIRATLRGIEEPPAVSSTGRGSFVGRITNEGTQLRYTVSYRDLEGNVLQSHIHLGQKGVNGGIAVFLCTNLGNGPAGTPTCPGPRAGTVSGVVDGNSIVGPSGQGLLPGEFAELLRAIDREVTYVNVHTEKHTGGEIRGQIQADEDGDGDSQ